MEGVILPHIMKELREQRRNLDMEIHRSGDILGEVSVKGGSGYKCVVNLEERSCSCRKWQVSGIPCRHAIAFITSLREPLEKYVDKYYSVEKFKAAYEGLIPAMPDKAQWPQSDHDFFMHPPLLKATAGRRQDHRFKGCTEGNGSTTRKKGSHQCKVCKKYGHRWYKCKDGDPDDIAALLLEKGPPKKRKKKNEPSCESSSIVPVGLPKTMHFPPSQSASISLGSGHSLRSGSGSNQLEPLSIEYPMVAGETTPPLATTKSRKEKKATKGTTKGAGKKKKKKQVLVPHDSPAMGTRSKTPQKNSPSSHTRSKRKLSLPDPNS
ncbi:unnamed protein product [Urochloa humidicola]